MCSSWLLYLATNPHKPLNEQPIFHYTYLVRPTDLWVQVRTPRRTEEERLTRSAPDALVPRHRDVTTGPREGEVGEEPTVPLLTGWARPRVGANGDVLVEEAMGL